MKKLIFIIFFATSFVTVFAQQNISEEILNYKSPKSELIAKARQLIIDKFIEGDLIKVKQVADYICDSLADKEHLGLWPTEKILIGYWTDAYQAVIKESFSIDNYRIMIKNNRYNTQITPQRDVLYQKLIDKSIESYEILADKIDASNMSNEDKAFLHMYLQNALLNDDLITANITTQDDLNVLANKYLNDYPESKYNNIVRQQIRYELIPSKWGWGLEVFSGYGIFTGDLHDYFTNPIPIGFSFDIAYAKFLSSIRFYCGLNGTKKDIEFKHKNRDYIWENDSHARVFIPEFSLGYSVLENKRFKIVPYALVGANNITPTAKDVDDYPELKDADRTSFNYGLGLMVDFKISTSRNNSYHSYFPSEGYWSVRLRYSYNINNFKGWGGNFHSITIGIGGLGRVLNRKLD